MSRNRRKMYSILRKHLGCYSRILVKKKKKKVSQRRSNKKCKPKEKVSFFVSVWLCTHIQTESFLTSATSQPCCQLTARTPQYFIAPRNIQKGTKRQLGSKRLAGKIQRRNTSSTELKAPCKQKEESRSRKRKSRERMKMYKPVKICRMSEKQKDGQKSKGDF